MTVATIARLLADWPPLTDEQLAAIGNAAQLDEDRGTAA